MNKLTNPSSQPHKTRRVFMFRSAIALSLSATTFGSQAQTMVSESDPQASALGYNADASKTDKSKYKSYAAGQACSSCTLYQGKATDTAGACPLFAGKQVAAKAWCSAWVKKSA